MKESPFDPFMDSGEEDFDLKELLLKYLKYWPLFLGGLLVSLFIGHLYVRYTPETHYSEARIKILKGDDKNVLNIGNLRSLEDAVKPSK